MRLDQPLELGAARRVVARQEADGDAVRPGGGSSRLDDARGRSASGQLHEYPGAVARRRVGAGGAAMLEVLERVERALDDLVVASPSSLATNATPQASCSKAGS